MGDIADDLFEKSQDEFYTRNNSSYKEPKKKILKEKVKVFWEIKNGDLIDIDNMTIEHLRNTLKMIVTRDLIKKE